MSIGKISAPALRHRIPAVAFSERKFSATCAVTSCPVWVTPSSTTPLSAHIVIRPFLSSFTREVRCMPAICIIISSSLPRLCRGCAIAFQRFCASSMAPLSGACIRLTVSSRRPSYRFSFLSSLIPHASAVKIYFQMPSIFRITSFISPISATVL